MAIVGIGTDLIEVKRIEAFAKKPGALERIFSAQEIAYCLSRTNRFEHLAVRFAAKEAVYKALPFDEIAFRNIQVKNLENGRPEVVVDDKRMEGLKLFISLSHTSAYAIAYAVVEK